MKTETAINRILNSNISIELMISKLKTLALKTYPSSPNQKLVIETYKKMELENDLDKADQKYQAQMMDMEK